MASGAWAQHALAEASVAHPRRGLQCHQVQSEDKHHRAEPDSSNRVRVADHENRAPDDNESIRGALVTTRGPGGARAGT